jgi:hypothetical protein
MTVIEDRVRPDRWSVAVDTAEEAMQLAEMFSEAVYGRQQ